jgi:hypothetical protein
MLIPIFNTPDIRPRDGSPCSRKGYHLSYIDGGYYFCIHGSYVVRSMGTNVYGPKILPDYKRFAERPTLNMPHNAGDMGLGNVRLEHLTRCRGPSQMLQRCRPYRKPQDVPFLTEPTPRWDVLVVASSFACIEILLRNGCRLFNAPTDGNQPPGGKNILVRNNRWSDHQFFGAVLRDLFELNPTTCLGCFIC